MSTGKRWIDASAIRKAKRWYVGREDQWITKRIFAAVIASALVLPAFVPDFEAFGLRSSTLFIVGLFILIGFGVPYYILLRSFQEADETESGEGKKRELPTTLKPGVLCAKADPEYGNGLAKQLEISLSEQMSGR